MICRNNDEGLEIYTLTEHYRRRFRTNCFEFTRGPFRSIPLPSCNTFFPRTKGLYDDSKMVFSSRVNSILFPSTRARILLDRAQLSPSEQRDFPAKASQWVFSITTLVYTLYTINSVVMCGS